MKDEKSAEYDSNGKCSKKEIQKYCILNPENLAFKLPEDINIFVSNFLSYSKDRMPTAEQMSLFFLRKTRRENGKPFLKKPDEKNFLKRYLKFKKIDYSKISEYRVALYSEWCENNSTLDSDEFSEEFKEERLPQGIKNSWKNCNSNCKKIKVIDHQEDFMPPDCNSCCEDCEYCIKFFSSHIQDLLNRKGSKITRQAVEKLLKNN